MRVKLFGVYIFSTIFDTSVGRMSKSDFSYPHCLANLQEVRVYDSESLNIPPTYSNFLMKNSEMMDPKMIRLTNHRPSARQKVGIALHPLAGHPAQTQQKIVCDKCGSCMSPKTAMLSVCQFRCGVCKHENQQVMHNSEAYLHNSAIDLIENTSNRNDEPLKQVCFVVELSEENHNANIITAIANVVEALLLEGNLCVAFLLFDDRNVYFIDQHNEGLICMPVLGTVVQIEDYPLPKQHLFRKIADVSDQSLQIVADMLYESTIKSQTKLTAVLHYITNVLTSISADTEYKFMLTTLQESQTQTPLGVQQQNKNSKKEKSQAVLNLQGLLTCYMQFFIVAYHTSYHSCMKALKQNVRKIYDPHCNIANSLYYDLYHSITEPKFYNITMTIRTTPSTEISSVGLQSYQPYKLISKKHHKNFNEYVYKCPKIQMCGILPIGVSNGLDTTPEGMQRNVQFQFSLPRKTRYINCCFKVDPKRKRRYERVDGETLFYFLLKEHVEGYQKSERANKIPLHKYYNEKLKELALNFETEYGDINFPMTYQHTFLYSHMLQKLSALNSYDPTHEYQKYSLLTQPLQTFSKHIYHRIYSYISPGSVSNSNSNSTSNSNSNQNSPQESPERSTPCLQNIKNCGSKFRTDSVIVVDNGCDIILAVGQNVSALILNQIFGQEEIDITELHELPYLETNLALRNAIEMLRVHNDGHFQPLRVMGLFSQEFDNLVSKHLYIKEEHKMYLQKLWNRSKRKY